MKFKNIHPWNLSPPGAVRIQNRLKRKIKLKKFLGMPKLVTGADVAFKRGRDTGWILSVPSGLFYSAQKIIVCLNLFA